MISPRALLLIANREFLAHLGTRSFIFGVLLTPLLLLLVMRLPTAQSDPPPIVVGIVDLSGKIGVDLIDAIREHADHGGRPLAAGAGLVFIAGSTADPDAATKAIANCDMAAADGECEVVLVFPASFPDDTLIEVRTPQGRALQPGFTDTLLAVLERTVAKTLARQEGVSQELRRQLQRRCVLIHQESPIVPQHASGVEAVLQGLAFVIMLYLTTLALSHALLTSVIEEKSSRVVELLLSAVSPLELMTGKILGIGMLGACLVSVWVGLGWATGSTTGAHVPQQAVVGFCIFFILGFFFYAAILAGVGATVSSLKEAQHLVTPVTVMMMVPVLFWWSVHQEPEGVLARVLSWFPPTTPVTMMNRMSSPVPPSNLEVAMTSVWMVLAIAAAIALAAKLFRIGILSQGSPPRFATLMRWLARRS